jgi:hypothetical protein
MMEEFLQDDTLDIEFTEEGDEVLSRLSDALLIDNLEEQLNTVVLTSLNPTNFLSIFDDRYNYLTQVKFINNDDAKGKFLSIKTRIYSEVKNGIENKFDISSNLDPEYIVPSNYYFYIKKLYEFFVIDYRRNLIQFFQNYLIQNKAELVKNYKATTDKKDLGVSSLRKTFNKMDDVIILYNFEEIITDAISHIEDPLFIIETIVNSDPDEAINHTINELFVDGIEESLLGVRFASKFFSCLQDEEYSPELMADIKGSFLKTIQRK